MEHVGKRHILLLSFASASARAVIAWAPPAGRQSHRLRIVLGDHATGAREAAEYAAFIRLNQRQDLFRQHPIPRCISGRRSNRFGKIAHFVRHRPVLFHPCALLVAGTETTLSQSAEMLIEIKDAPEDVCSAEQSSTKLCVRALALPGSLSDNPADPGFFTGLTGCGP
jgi:hypothetical protein